MTVHQTSRAKHIFCVEHCLSCPLLCPEHLFLAIFNFLATRLLSSSTLKVLIDKTDDCSIIFICCCSCFSVGESATRATSKHLDCLYAWRRGLRLYVISLSCLFFLFPLSSFFLTSSSPCFLSGIRIPSIINAGGSALVAFAECRRKTGDGCNPTVSRTSNTSSTPVHLQINTRGHC